MFNNPSKALQEAMDAIDAFAQDPLSNEETQEAWDVANNHMRAIWTVYKEESPYENTSMMLVHDQYLMNLYHVLVMMKISAESEGCVWHQVIPEMSITVKDTPNG